LTHLADKVTKSDPKAVKVRSNVSIIEQTKLLPFNAFSNRFIVTY